MSYIWGKGTSGNLITKDKRVKEEYRSISYQEHVIGCEDDPEESFCLSLFYSEDDCPEGHIEIEFHKEIDFDKFKTRLEKAFVVRYEDTPDKREIEGDDLIGSGGSNIMYEKSVTTYANKLRIRRLTILGVMDQKRKFIVEFENKRDRRNFINILNKASRLALNDTGEVNILNNIIYNSFWREANKSMDEGNWVKAIEVFSNLLALNPEDAFAWERRGLVYAYDRQYDKSIDDFTQSITLDDTFAETYNNRGMSYYTKGLYDEAIADYDRAIHLSPDIAVFYANRGLAYMWKCDITAAIADYDKAIEIEPTLPETHNSRGEAYAKLGKNEKAIADFDRELEMTPDNPAALANRVRVLKLMNKKKKGGK